jgi:hypothetical protein
MGLSPIVASRPNAAATMGLIARSLPTSVVSKGSTSLVKAALERAYKLPAYSAPKVPPPAAGQGLLGRLIKGVTVVVAPFLQSNGEFELAKMAGFLPDYVSARDDQFASMALRDMGWQSTSKAANSDIGRWSADQRGRMIMGAAELMQLKMDGKIDAASFRTGMTQLRAQVNAKSNATGRNTNNSNNGTTKAPEKGKTRAPTVAPQAAPAKTAAPAKRPTTAATPGRPVPSRTPSDAVTDLARRTVRDSQKTTPPTGPKRSDPLGGFTQDEIRTKPSATEPLSPALPTKPKAMPTTPLSPEGQKSFDRAAARAKQQMLEQREKDYAAGRITREQALSGLTGADRAQMAKRLNQIDSNRVVKDVGSGGNSQGTHSAGEVKRMLQDLEKQGGVASAPESQVRKLTGLVESALKQTGLGEQDASYLKQQLSALKNEQAYIHKGREVIAALKQGATTAQSQARAGIALAQRLASIQSPSELKRIYSAVAADPQVGAAAKTEVAKAVYAVQKRELLVPDVVSGKRQSHAQDMLPWYSALDGMAKAQSASVSRSQNEAIRSAGLTPAGVVRFIELAHGKAAIQDPARLASLITPALASITKSSEQRTADKKAGVVDPLDKVAPSTVLSIYEQFDEGPKTKRPDTVQNAPTYSYSTYSARDVVIASAYSPDESLSSLARNLSSFKNGALNEAFGPSRYGVKAPDAATRKALDAEQKQKDAAPGLDDHSAQAKQIWVTRANQYVEQANPEQRAKLADALRTINDKLSGMRSGFPNLGRTEPLISAADLVRYFTSEKKLDFSQHAKVGDLVAYAEGFAGIGLNVPGRKAWIQKHLNPTPITSGAGQVVLLAPSALTGDGSLPMTRRETLAMEKALSKEVKPVEDSAKKLGGAAAMKPLRALEEGVYHLIEANATSPQQKEQYKKLGILYVEMAETIERYQGQVQAATDARDGTTTIDEEYKSEMAGHRKGLEAITDKLFSTQVSSLKALSNKSMLEHGLESLRNGLGTDQQKEAGRLYFWSNHLLLTKLRERLRATEPGDHL